MCLLTERWLTPGSFTAFRAAWEPQPQPEQLVRAYHLRDQGDPDHIISFGFFDLTAAEFDAFVESPELIEMQRARLAAMAEHVADTGVDGVFEVVDVVEGPSAWAGDLPLEII